MNGTAANGTRNRLIWPRNTASTAMAALATAVSVLIDNVRRNSSVERRPPLARTTAHTRDALTIVDASTPDIAAIAARAETCWVAPKATNTPTAMHADRPAWAVLNSVLRGAPRARTKMITNVASAWAVTTSHGRARSSAAPRATSTMAKEWP